MPTAGLSFFPAGHPGSTNDSIAHRHSPFPDMLEKLPLRKCIIADNACNATEHLITPFCGVNKNDKAKDAFNYYLSQCRIRIECTFGRLVNKFQIFKRPLRCSVHNSTRMAHAATKLHNWCINHGSEDLLTLKHSEADLEGLPEEHFKLPQGRPSDSRSMMRDFILNDINCRTLRRPAHNVKRNTKT